MEKIGAGSHWCRRRMLVVLLCGVCVVLMSARAEWPETSSPSRSFPSVPSTRRSREITCGARRRADLERVTLKQAQKMMFSRPMDHSSSTSVLALAQTQTQTKPRYTLKPTSSTQDTWSIGFLSVFLPWLYFLCVSMNIPSLPSYVNYVLNKGDAHVTSASARVYGNLTGIDAFFTFLSVNLVGCLSDIFGRKPFMFFSAAGLGCAYFLASRATSSRSFYFASAVDGLTSCMLSQSQAYITDMVADHNRNIPKDSKSEQRNKNLSIALSRFQGRAIGMAFLFGIPLGSYLYKRGPAAPLKVSVIICAVNCLLIAGFLPASPGTLRKWSSVHWTEANPLGAVRLLTRNRKLLISGLSYFLINLAQAGVQATWINYLQAALEWSTASSGATLMLVGAMVGVVPPLIIPRMGVKNAISAALLVYTASTVFLGTSTACFYRSFEAHFLVITLLFNVVISLFEESVRDIHWHATPGHGRFLHAHVIGSHDRVGVLV